MTPLEKYREKYPSYRNKSDEEMTAALFKKYATEDEDGKLNYGGRDEFDFGLKFRGIEESGWGDTLSKTGKDIASNLGQGVVTSPIEAGAREIDQGVGKEFNPGKYAIDQAAGHAGDYIDLKDTIRGIPENIDKFGGGHVGVAGALSNWWDKLGDKEPTRGDVFSEAASIAFAGKGRERRAQSMLEAVGTTLDKETAKSMVDYTSKWNEEINEASRKRQEAFIVRKWDSLSDGEVGGLKAIFNEAIGSVAPSLAVGMLTTAVTKSTLAGAGAIGEMTFGLSYNEGIHQMNLSHDDAVDRAAVSAVAEIAMSKLELDKLTMTVGKWMKKAATGAVGEGLEESLVEIVNMAYDKKVIGTNITMKEALQRIIHAGFIGAIAGAGTNVVLGGKDAPKAKPDQRKKAPLKKKLTDVELSTLSAFDDNNAVDSSVFGDSLESLIENKVVKEANGKVILLPEGQRQRRALKESLAAEVEAAAKETNANPTKKQIKDGYKKGSVSIQGMDVSVETPKGAERSGTGEDGKKWTVNMNHHYGDLKGTKAADGDPLDVFIGDNPASNKVFTIDQTKKDGSFDETKTMLGFDTKDQAVDAYKSNYEDGWNVGKVTEQTVGEFKTWTKEGDTTKPIAEYEKPTQTKTQNNEIVETPVDEISLSDDVPQFKEGANAKGVVEPLGGKFDRTGVSPIQIWVRKDGRKEVITGRHRLDLARRSGEKTIPSQYHYEKDGFGADQAAQLDAILNIREGQGKVKDYVEFIKATEITEKEADAQGILARATGKRAYAIATNGSDALIASHRGDVITDEAAVRIANAAPNNESLQAVGIKAIQEGKTIAMAENMVKAVSSIAGESSGDMFGFDDSAMKEAEAMAKKAVAKQAEIQRTLSAIQGASKRPDLAKKEGVNVKNVKAVKKRIAELKQEKTAWNSWHTNPELVAQLKPDFSLDAETESERANRESQEKEVSDKQESENKKTDDKLKADKKVDGFTLAGSDLEADQAAAAGQQDLLSGASDEELVEVTHSGGKIKEIKQKSNYTGNKKNPEVNKKALNILSEKEFYTQYVQHIDIKGKKEGNSKEVAKNILSKGFSPGFGFNALPPSTGRPVANIIDKNYSPKKGHYVYLAPKGAWEDTQGGIKINDGWMPKPYEIIVVSKDNPNMYQEYLNAIKIYKKANGDVIYSASSSPDIASSSESDYAADKVSKKYLDKLSSTEEEAHEDAPKHARKATDILRRNGGSILANSIGKLLWNKKPANLIGQKIENSTDLATLAQIYRNPSFETFRIFFVDDSGKIVHQTGLTSRRPGSTGAFPSGQTKIESVFELERQMKKSGATGYYLLHNHPSGAMPPSPGDVNATKEFDELLPGLKAHIVVNQNKFAHITPSGTYEIKDVDSSQSYNLNKYDDPTGMIGRLITAPINLVNMWQELYKKDFVVVVGVGGGATGIRAIMEIPVGVTEGNRKTKLMAMIRKFQRDTGSGSVFLANVPKQYMRFVEDSVRNGVVKDAVDVDGNSLMDKGVVRLKERGEKTSRVAEKEGKYSKQTQAQRREARANAEAEAKIIPLKDLDVEIETTKPDGKVVKMRGKADTILRRIDKRREAGKRLLRCINA